MALILSIDTAVKVCSVALHQEGNLLAIAELLHEKSSSAMLTTLIDDVLKYATQNLQNLDAIAVSKGPGSYTGLRIGTATAKGLCFTLDKPLLAINTLEAMAWQVQLHYSDALLCPMIDARRMEIYGAIYDANTMKTILPTHAHIIEADSFAQFLSNKPVVFFGDGAKKCEAVIQHPNAVFLNELIQPSAKTLGRLAYEAYQNQIFEDIETFEPFYLKEFIGTVKGS